MKKPKVSKLKRSTIKQNKLVRQGKIKKKTSKSTKKHKPKHPNKNHVKDQSKNDNGDSLFKMTNSDNLDFLRKAVSDGTLLSNGNTYNDTRPAKKQYSKPDDNENIEGDYEKEYFTTVSDKKTVRHLLPLKTSKGLIRRTLEEDIKEEEEIPDQNLEDEEMNESEDDFQIDTTDTNIQENNLDKPISTAEIIALREQTLSQYKLRIGVLSSGLLEDPQNKVKNIALLLEMLNEYRPELQYTVKKLVALSLTEVFKDILPSYQIKHQDNPSVKLKKDTKHLQDYEKSLLKGYRLFLTKLEKFAKVLYKKKGDTIKKSEPVLRLGELSLKCLGELLVTHQYFNYSVNLVQLLTPYLDHSSPAVRKIVYDTVVSVFKSDKKGEITLTIVRRINHLVKARSHTVHNEVVAVMLALRIKDVNLDREKELELKQKKFMTYKQKLLRMSKRERKRSKKLEELEKELLETKAEENKQSKQKYLTEVMKVLFTIYFRILKKAPSSKVLSTALEGVAKFAHCINLEFYQDMVNVLDGLMATGTLKYREQLHCVETVFAILSGHGDALNIDPLRFYTHLYRNLYCVQAGKSHDDIQIVLRILETVLVQRHKRITLQRLLAFTKRISIISSQVLHNGSLGCLGLIKRVMQLGKTVDQLLDVDTSVGQGIYNPELDEPEHCNASSTALWELTALQRHYHPTVRMFAQHIAMNAPVNGKHTLPAEIAKMNGIELFKEFDPSNVVFKPSVTTPSTIVMDAKIRPPPVRCNDPCLAYLEDKIVNTKMNTSFKCLYKKSSISSVVKSKKKKMKHKTT
uniref:Nucleolar complex protein 3 homolog n=1 Tax=Clastoptera arizonana TaxID=38151 RepID=A0A1B6C2B6_9HEMI